MAERRASFFTKMRQLKKDIYSRRDVNAAKIYAQVERYVLDCSYTTYKDARRFVKFVMGGYTDDQVSAQMGVRNETVRWREHTLSICLYGIFGDHFFEAMQDVEANEKELDNILYYIRSKSLREEYVLTDIVALIRADQSNTLPEDLFKFSLDDCFEEIDFLNKHSLPRVKKEFERLDVNKLQYLLSMLEGDAGSVDDCCKLFKALDVHEE